MTRILFVDDEIQIRRALDINLRAHGHRVRSARTSPDCKHDF
jgi:DNA-binding NtrC family response regulator